jgi:hypothetical protein
MLPALLGATGCFDVHSVDQGPWVIDDFEDGDLTPADRNFGPWDCYTYSPPNQDCHRALGRGAQGVFSLKIDFTVVDPADGKPEYPGAGVQTVSTTPEDFSRFSKVVFRSKSVPAVPALPSSTRFGVQLYCSTARLEDGTKPGNLHVEQPFAVTAEWQLFSLPMAQFSPSPYDTAHILGGPGACVQRVDAIQFDVQPSLSDGQSAMGQLSVDEINFQ